MLLTSLTIGHTIRFELLVLYPNLASAASEFSTELVGDNALF